MTGATPITFFKPKATGVYSIYNRTGENLKGLYIYNTGAEDKGANLAENFVDGAAVSYTDFEDAVLTVEFVTESDYTNAFTTLHIEEAPITLLAADAMTGATPITFFAPAE